MKVQNGIYILFFNGEQSEPENFVKMHILCSNFLNSSAF